MLRRLFTLIVLLAVVGAAVYLWRFRAGSTTMDAAARQFGSDARNLGAEAKERLDGVGNELQDVKVTASVKTALALTRSLRPYPIEVSTQNRVVTLRGRVDGDELRARAEAVAVAVPDVSRVVNQLQGTSGGAPDAPAGNRTLGESFDDHSREMKVRLALSLNQNLKGSDVTVHAYRREVTLGGDVASSGQRDLALQAARDTDGSDSVIDRIHVVGTPEASRAIAPGGASNAERAAAAQRALAFNPYLTGFELRVREEGGRLVLRGQVSTPVERDLAGLLAREAAGGPVENAVEIRSATSRSNST
jgi:hyperosmotically inducible periplasmic protein